MTAPVAPPTIVGNKSKLGVLTQSAPPKTTAAPTPTTTSTSPKAAAITKAATKSAPAAPKAPSGLSPKLLAILQKLKPLYGNNLNDAINKAFTLTDDQLASLGVNKGDLWDLALSTSTSADTVNSAWNSIPATTASPAQQSQVAAGPVGPVSPTKPAPGAPFSVLGGTTGGNNGSVITAPHNVAGPQWTPPASGGGSTYQPGTNQKSIPPTNPAGVPFKGLQNVIDLAQGAAGNAVDAVNRAQNAPLPVPSSNINATDINNLLNSSGPTTVDIPNAPAPYQFKLNDFTKQADDATSQAFAPQYQALDQGKAAAQTQYGQSDKTVNSLYQNLAKSDTTQSAANQSAYKSALQNAAASTKDLQTNVADTYNNTAKSQADLLQSLGIQAAAPDVLADQSAASNFNQVQAAQQGKAQQDYVQNSANADQSYQSNMLNADQAQGTATRADLVNQLNGVLDQYDQQKSSVASDQSQSALQLAQQLQGSDMSLQQANYGSQQDAYSNALQKAQLQLSQSGQNQSSGVQQAQLALQLQQAQDASSMGQYNAQYQAGQDAITNQMAQQQQTNTDLNNQGQLALGAAQLDETHNEFGTTTQQAANTAQQKANPALTFDQGSPYSQWVAQQKASKAPDALLNLINQITLGKNPDGTPSNNNAMSSQQAFMAAVGIEAAANGIPSDQAVSAASSYWQNVLGMPGQAPSTK